MLTQRQRQDREAPKPHPSGLRWPSGANPNSIKPKLARHVSTEDDILHIKGLPDFDQKLSQSDAELLLSYLTVPYIRRPLTMEFFATQNRVHALGSTEIQRLLWDDNSDGRSIEST